MHKNDGCHPTDFSGIIQFPNHIGMDNCVFKAGFAAISRRQFEDKLKALFVNRYILNGT